MSSDNLDDIMGQLLEAEDAGRPPSLEELVAKYPQHAAELRAYLANRALVQELASQSLAAPRRPADSGWGLPADHHAHVGDYELIETIARGGMGVVYRARHVVVGRWVALKMIRDGQFATSSQRQRFLIEAQAAARLDHANIVPLFEVSEHQGQPYYTMKLVEGPSLTDHLATWRDQPRPAAHLIRDLARAVHYAHQRGIMHRDLKPANILLEERTSGGTDTGQDSSGSVSSLKWRPLIADFGLAKLQDSDEGLTHSGDILGTPAYMAPEQASGAGHDVATTTDIYSLGAILYALLTGRPVFQGGSPGETLRRVVQDEPESPRRSNPHVPRDLETICLKCLEKEPRRRYSSADALADDLQRWLEHRPIHARRSGLEERLWKWACRRPAAAALVTLAAAAALTIFSGSLWYNARLNREVANVNRERQRAADRELMARRHAYAASINLAYRAWDTGQSARVFQLLEAEVPQEDQLDLRSFDWFQLWHRVHQGLRKTVPAGSGAIRGLQFVADSPTIVCGSADGAIRVVPPDSEKAFVWIEQGPPIRATSMSHKGDRIAALDANGRLTIRDYPSGREKFATDSKVGTFYTVTSTLAFAPDDAALAAVLDFDRVGLLNPESGRQIATMGSSGFANALAVSPDGTVLAVATNNAGVAIIRPDAPEQPPELLGDAHSYILQVAISPDGETIACADEEGQVTLWQFKERRPLASLAEHTGAVYSLAFTRDGKYLASGGEDGTVAVRELSSGCVRRFGHPATVYAVAFSAAGDVMATGDGRGMIRIWDLHDTSSQDQLRGHDGSVYSLAFRGRKSQLASGGKDHSIRIWDVSTGKPMAVWRDHSGTVPCVAYSPDGSRLASGNCYPGDAAPGKRDEGGSLRFWDADSGRVIARVAAHGLATWGLAYSPDGRTVATAGYRDNVVALWDAVTGEPRATLMGHPQRVWRVAYSPDGTLLASCSASENEGEDTVLVWEVATGRPRHRLRIRWVWSVAFSPDGRLLATGSEGGLVKLWDLRTGREAVPIQGHATAVKCVTFSPDGRILASASADRTIRFWDVVTGDERAALHRHDQPITSLAFSQDGRILASGDAEGTIFLWRAADRRSLVWREKSGRD